MMILTNASKISSAFLLLFFLFILSFRIFRSKRADIQYRARKGSSKSESAYDDDDNNLPLDYYQILGVSKHATLQQIEAAFRNLNAQQRKRRRSQMTDKKKRKKHQEDIRLIREAYEVLSDQTQRKRYDEWHDEFEVTRLDSYLRFGTTAMEEVSREEDSNEEDSSDSITEGEGIIFKFNCSLEEVYTGITKHLTVKDTTPIEKIFEIQIAPGARDNDRWIFPPSADCPITAIFELQISPHHSYQRRGNDLVWTCKLTQSAYEKGARIKLPMLDGSSVYVNTKAHPEIIPGANSTWIGKGMPIIGKNGKKGDFIILYDVE